MAIGFSHTALPRLVGGRYYDLTAAAAGWQALGRQAPAGIELVLLPEWDGSNPPLTATDAQWEKCPRYSDADLLAWVQDNNLPVLSVHANRDIGMHFCSGSVQRGQELLAQAMDLCASLNTEICVAHLWDTWSKDFAPHSILEATRPVTKSRPRIILAAEYLPTSLPGHSPPDILKIFPHWTWDTHWARLYNDTIPDDISAIAHLHLQGEYASMDLAPVRLAYDRGYRGHVILEPRGKLELSQVTALLKSIASAKRRPK